MSFKTITNTVATVCCWAAYLYIIKNGINKSDTKIKSSKDSHKGGPSSKHTSKAKDSKTVSNGTDDKLKADQSTTNNSIPDADNIITTKTSTSNSVDDKNKRQLSVVSDVKLLDTTKNVAQQMMAQIPVPVTETINNITSEASDMKDRIINEADESISSIESTTGNQFSWICNSIYEAFDHNTITTEASDDDVGAAAAVGGGVSWPRSTGMKEWPNDNSNE